MSFPMKLCLKICVFLVVSIVASDESELKKVLVFAINYFHFELKYNSYIQIRCI